MTKISEFHIGENVTNQSGGLRISLTKGTEEVNARQEKIIKILEKYSGIQIVETEQGPGVDFSNTGNHHIPRIIRLLQENSILQDALHYLGTDVMTEWKSISDITNTVTIMKMNMFDNSSPKVNIYNFVDINIGEIIFDLQSDIHRGVFHPSNKELAEIKSLEEARKRFLDFFNKPKGVVMIG